MLIESFILMVIFLQVHAQNMLASIVVVEGFCDFGHIISGLRSATSSYLEAPVIVCS